MGRLKYVLIKPSHGRRFSTLLCGMIRIDDLEQNVEETECKTQYKSASNRNPNSKPESWTFEVHAKKPRNSQCFSKFLWVMIRHNELEQNFEETECIKQ